MNLGIATAPCLILVSASWAQVTQRVSVDSGGVQGDSFSQAPSISAGGRYVAFGSGATNLAPGDTNGARDIFVRDRQLGTTERVSVDSGGVQGNSDSDFASISSDGRYVAFQSFATNLVPGDTNAVWDIFVRDRQLGTTERASVDSGGAQGNGDSIHPVISSNGRYVAFESHSTNLVPGDTNSVTDIFVRDLQLGTTERVSVDSGGVQGNNDSFDPTISSDGRCVAFFSYATNLVPGDTNGGFADVFVRDRQLGTTECVSVDSGGAQGIGHSTHPSISSDGRYVAFESRCTTLVPGDTNGYPDIFVRDRRLGTTERVSVDSGGAQGNGPSYFPSTSSDGRYVAFESPASNFVPGDTNSVNDIFVRDRQLGTTERASVDSGGVEGSGESIQACISADGRYVTFASVASNLVSGDTNGSTDAFLHDRDATGFTSVCNPGADGVISCPCANPPSGPGRGCDNSAATGGATFAPDGVAYLSIDSLVFMTSAEKPTATSILLQGNAFAASGIVYGQGVRCVAGTLMHLFVKTAVAGSITAPDFTAGDPTVSARSAAKGDVIQPGESRYYLVYYRDPVVLGGCPASATFNATQTGQVTWWP